MAQNTYQQTFEQFLAENPDISPEWRALVEPVIQGADDELYTFIMSFIFM